MPNKTMAASLAVCVGLLAHAYWPTTETKVELVAAPKAVEPVAPVVMIPKPQVPSVSYSYSAVKPMLKTPVLEVDPKDPYLEDMEILTAKDCKYCPRIWRKVVQGQTFYKDKQGKVWYVDDKTKKLTRAT